MLRILAPRLGAIPRHPAICRLPLARPSSTCPHKQQQQQQQQQQQHPKPQTQPPKRTSLAFWQSAPTWRRASVNTLRCLVGCSLGDFAAMWYLQAHHSDLGMWPIMAVSIASGLASSITLETVLLRIGRDGLSWPRAARTAVGMSFISMVTMEAVENAVDYQLTGGSVVLDSPLFWAAAAMSMAAGFLAPLPYNYARLRRYGRACH